MKKIVFSALFFSAIAWLWIGHIIAADGYLINSSGVTTTSSGGGAAPAGIVMTNGNNNAFVIFTNNSVSVNANSSGIFTVTNYVASGLGSILGTNGSVKSTTTIGSGPISGSASCAIQLNNSGSSTGYIEWWKTTGPARLGFMGFSTTDIPLTLENSAKFVVTGGDQINSGNVGATNGFGFLMATTPVYLTNIVYTNVTLDFGSTATLTFSDLLVNVGNLKSNDVATICPPAISQTNGIFSAWVSNTTLYARYHNYQATAINPASGIFNIQVFQYR